MRFGLGIISSKKKINRKVSEEEIRSEKESRPFSCKKNLECVGCADRFQNDNMLACHATKKKTACGKHVGTTSRWENGTMRKNFQRAPAERACDLV